METNKNTQREPIIKEILWFLVHSDLKATTRQTAEAINRPFASVTSVLTKLHRHLGDEILKREPIPDKRGFTYEILGGTKLSVNELYGLYGSRAGLKGTVSQKSPFSTQIEKVLHLLRDGKERDSSQIARELGFTILERSSLTAILSRLYKRLPRTTLTRRKETGKRAYIYQLLNTSLSVPQLYKSYSLRTLKKKRIKRRVMKRTTKPAIQAGINVDALKTQIEELINQQLGGPKVELEDIQVSLRLKDVGLKALTNLLKGF